MDAEIISFKDNKLLGRKEVTYLFKDVAGKLTKKEAVEFVAKQHSVNPASVIPIKLKGVFGTRNVEALFYIYSDMEEARKQLPEYIFLRLLPPEERSRVLEEKRRKEVRTG